MTESETRKLDAIVGSAIRALVENGADDAAVGRFAASHRAHVAQILGQPAELPGPPDLLALVTQAVQQAMSMTAAAPRRAPARKRLTVELTNGRRTSVTVDASLLQALQASKGGSRPQATAFIQELARNAPDEAANRSGWVHDKLREIVAQAPDLQASAPPPGVARH